MDQPLIRDWQEIAACRYTDQDAMFDYFGPKQANYLKRIFCDVCPVKRKCLAEALTNKEEFGIWGGLTSEERDRLVGIYPGVENWKLLLGA